MLERRKRTSLRVFSFSSKLEPEPVMEPDLQTVSGQGVPAPQHWLRQTMNISVKQDGESAFSMGSKSS